MTPQPGNVFASDVVDRGPWIFYDRLTTAVSTVTSATYFHFAVGIGGAKTKADTNLTSNRLPPPQAFSVQSIGFTFGSAMLNSDLALFLKNYFFEFRISSKIYAEGPLQFFPGGAGVWANQASTHATAALFSTVANGEPSLLACRRFPDYPRIIPANIPFTVNAIAGATFTTAAAVAITIVSPAYGGLDNMASLDGILDREVM